MTVRAAALLSLGILLIVLQGNLYPLVGRLGVYGATPSLVLPLIIFLGVHEASIARGASLAFAMGYAMDLLASAPIGLFTLAAVSVWWLARIAGVRLTAQAWWTQAALAFGFSLVESVLVLVLLTIFGAAPQRAVDISSVALPRAASTGICSLFVFELARRVHLGATSSREKGGAWR